MEWPAERFDVVISVLREHKTELANSDFKALYKTVGEIKVDWDKPPYVPILTDILYESDIDPLQLLDYVPAYCFYGLDLESIEIPNHIKTIGYQAFRNCRKLQRVTLPDHLETLGGGAFGYCEMLKSIRIPGSLQSFGLYAFWESGLKEVEFGGTMEQWVKVVSSDWYGINRATVHCTDGTMRCTLNGPSLYGNWYKVT